MAQYQRPVVKSQQYEEGDDKPRGRRRSREHDHGDDDASMEGVGMGDREGSEAGSPPGGDEPSRKRRRSRKGLDKKFPCPTEGCGKSYSRAEHLHRHQLNHAPKQIFNCEFPDCQRTFVRSDLRARHQERHTARGSQLQRRESLMSNSSLASPVSNGVQLLSIQSPASTESPKSPESARPNQTANNLRAAQLRYPPDSSFSPFSPTTSHQTTFTSSSVAFTPSESVASPKDNTLSQQGGFRRTNSDQISPATRDVPRKVSNPKKDQSHQSFSVVDNVRSNLQPNAAYNMQNASHGHPVPHSRASPAHAASQDQHPQSQNEAPYVSTQNFAPFTLPPSGFSTAPTTTSRTVEDFHSRSPHPPVHSASMESYDSSHGQHSGPDYMMLDHMSAPANTLPVFGGEGYSRSPFAMANDFIAYLFHDPQIAQPSLGPQAYPGVYNDEISQYPTYFANDMNFPGFFPAPVQQHPMAVTSLLDTNLPENVISEEKSQEIVDLIKIRFNETDEAPVAKQKDALLEGDRTNDEHMLSRKMMQTYIGSYWVHFHYQLPILHRPTFSPDNTPDILLMAMMAIGASCLDRVHGYRITQLGAELANFLASHIRWEIFSHVDFRPPAKLWIFQAALLLEIYEKMYSTRALHERAHIHHATTITLMRRGSSLLGRSALDSPASGRDDGKHGVNGSRHSSTSGVTSPDEWWHHWVINEATRRAAFAAFVIDSTQATMFGHSVVMVAHEVRIPLPCDENLWSATSGAEVGRLEANLTSNGVKAISFLEGLKKTLQGKEVRTNSFGRTILMAGLLSVSWHMNQRDLHINSLGVSGALGARDRWRVALIKAFDFWKNDFDQSLSPEAFPGPYYPARKDDNAVFESRIVLHHLAHMAMHVDVVDCQIFARAKRLLGRTIYPQDLAGVVRRMDDWVRLARARDATYYALRFLSMVLLPDDSNEYNYIYTYSARDDVLLNRPWVLYFAALIVWSYAIALEGAHTGAVPPHDDFNAQVRDMHLYLRRLGKVGAPEDLKEVKGFNGCSGLLTVLKTTFEKTRWELLHEAAILLGNCIHLIGGGGS